MNEKGRVIRPFGVELEGLGEMGACLCTAGNDVRNERTLLIHAQSWGAGQSLERSASVTTRPWVM